MIGKDLGKTSGWAHRAVLKQSGVEQVSGAYVRPHRRRRPAPHRRRRAHGCSRSTTWWCAPGQESVRSLYDELVDLDPERQVHLIGGADVAAELDAKRAIEQGMRLAAGA